MQLDLQSLPLLPGEAAWGATRCWKGAVEGKWYLVIGTQMVLRTAYPTLSSLLT